MLNVFTFSSISSLCAYIALLSHYTSCYEYIVTNLVYTSICLVLQTSRYMRNVFRYVQNIFRYVQNVFHYMQNVYRYVQNKFRPV